MAHPYTLTTDGASPVELVDVKAYLRVDDPNEDEVIKLMLASVTRFGETYTGRDFSAKTWTTNLDCFEDKNVLRKSPLAGITSITYTDVDDVATPFTTFELFLRNQWSYFCLDNDTSQYPTDIKVAAAPITVVMTTRAPDNVDEIRLAIFQLMTRIWSERGDCETQKEIDAKVVESGAASFFDFCRIARV